MNNKNLPLLMNQSKKGRKAISLPEIGVEKSSLPNSKFLRDNIDLPEVGQLDLISSVSYTHLTLPTSDLV